MCSFKMKFQRKSKTEKKFSNYSQLLGIDDTILETFFTLKFKDRKIEKIFYNYYMKQKPFLRIIVKIIYLTTFILEVFLSPISEYLQSKIVNFTLLGFWLLLMLVYIFFSKKTDTKTLVDTANSIVIVSLSAYNSYISNMLPQFVNTDHLLTRKIYIFLIYSVLEIIFSIEFNLLLCLYFLILSFTINLIFLIDRINFNERRYIDLINCVYVITICSLLKRHYSLLIRENFVQNYKFRRYFSYCDDLINSMSGFQFTIKDEKILAYNNNFKKYSVQRYNSHKIPKLSKFPSMILKENNNKKFEKIEQRNLICKNFNFQYDSEKEKFNNNNKKNYSTKFSNFQSTKFVNSLFSFEF